MMIYVLPIIMILLNVALVILSYKIKNYKLAILYAFLVGILSEAFFIYLTK